MEKNNLYNKIKTDLKDAIENSDEFFVINFKSIISRIEDLRNIVGEKITNEDVLIVLKEIYKDTQQKKSEVYSSSKYYKEVERLLVVLGEYFISNGYKVEDYNVLELSNGVTLIKANTILDKINESQKLKNPVAEALLIVGIIIIILSFILGIVFGIVFGNISDELAYNSQFSLEIAIIYWFTGGISGLIFIGFSEIIKILHDIRRKLYH